MGHFVNREAYGTVTDSFFKMGLTDASGQVAYYHPTFLYESVWNLAGFLLLHFYSKKHRHYDGEIFTMYVAWYGLGRGWIEGLRTDSLYLFGTGLRVSQLLAILSCLAAVALLIRNLYLHPKIRNRCAFARCRNEWMLRLYRRRPNREQSLPKNRLNSQKRKNNALLRRRPMV